MRLVSAEDEEAVFLEPVGVEQTSGASLFRVNRSVTPAGMTSSD